MTDKEQRVSMLNEDLQAFRIKLPAADFQREYLGEWVDHADAMAYATTARVHQKCALCSIVLDLGPKSTYAQTYDATMAAHHAVCPKRPIEVDEMVRIVRTTTPRLHGTVGKVVTVDRAKNSHMPYRVKVEGDNFPWWCYEVERIRRPAAVQGFSPGERVVWRPTPGSPWASLAIDGEVVSVRGDDRRVWTMRVLAVAGGVPNNLPPPIGSVLDLTAAPGRVERVPTCGPGCQCGAHETAETRIEQTVHPATKEAGRYSEPPAPALVDGLTREQCSTRWLENRLAVEGGAAPPNVMTRMQRDVGRAMWLAGPGAKRSAELRDRVSADREAERNRVRVDVQDVE